MADFRNDRRCAKHFSNASGSKLNAGVGVYITDEARSSWREHSARSPRVCSRA
jgi:hypothetical protein